MTVQTQKFEAETQELLNLMIHSLYSDKEIFLRELISNASDAIDKLKFKSLTEEALKGLGENFEIRLVPNKENQTLTIIDNGIGMTREEVIQNIGTIARSGTKQFAQMTEELKDNPELIGQFGVGFYSAFMVAEKVVLHTRKAGTDEKEGTLWESSGDGSYSIDTVPRPEGHGTSITLHLKPLSEEDTENHNPQFFDEWTLKSIVKKYSDFISHPIKMETTIEDKEKGPQTQDETLNSQKAIWTRPSSEIKEEEYHEFYKHLTHDWNPPLKTIHFKAEGVLEFSSLMFIPSQPPMDYFYKDYKHGLNLYVNRVFIMNDCEELIPPYLRFVRGMIDSSDLSLNVSREILQKDRQIARMKKSLTGKVFSTLTEMLEKDRKNYESFWDHFGSTLKEGIPSDPSNVERIQDLLLFHTTASDERCTFKEYIARMKPEQKEIYYMTGDHLEQMKNSPYLERLRSKGFEVLLMNEKVDEWVTMGIQKIDEKALRSITSEDLNLESDDEKKQSEEEMKTLELKLEPVLKVMKETLKDQIKEVKLSNRLTESPACLVSAANEPSARMGRILKTMGQAMPESKRILEINAKHPVFEKMNGLSEQKQSDWSEILYTQALLNEGSAIPNPMEYSQKVTQILLDPN